MRKIAILLVFVATILIGCDQDKAKEKSKVAGGYISCLNYLKKPYVSSLDEFPVFCGLDRGRPILYYKKGYPNTIKLSFKEVNPLKKKTCLNDTCLYIFYKKDGSWKTSSLKKTTS